MMQKYSYISAIFYVSNNDYVIWTPSFDLVYKIVMIYRGYQDNMSMMSE